MSSDNPDKKGEITRKELEQSLKSLEARLDLRFDQFAMNMAEMMQQQMNEFISRIDPILKEIENAREDRAISSQQSSEIRERLTEHDQRISRLENSR